jgi:hypothetical protein
MSHENLNPANPSRPKRVGIVISNPSVSTTTGWPVGFWADAPVFPFHRSRLPGRGLQSRRRQVRGRCHE